MLFRQRFSVTHITCDWEKRWLLCPSYLGTLWQGDKLITLIGELIIKLINFPIVFPMFLYFCRVSKLTRRLYCSSRIRLSKVLDRSDINMHNPSRRVRIKTHSDIQSLSWIIRKEFFSCRRSISTTFDERTDQLNNFVLSLLEMRAVIGTMPSMGLICKRTNGSTISGSTPMGSLKLALKVIAMISYIPIGKPVKVAADWADLLPKWTMNNSFALWRIDTFGKFSLMFRRSSSKAAKTFLNTVMSVRNL